MKTVWFVFWITITLIFFSANSVLQARTETLKKSETIEPKGAKKIVADISYGAGKVYVDPTGSDQVAKFDLTYTSDRKEYDIEYEVKGDVGYLETKNESQSIRKVDSDHNQLDILLSNRYSMELKLEVGACEATIDLGGLRLTDLDLEMGAASGTIDFSTPNPDRMKEMKIEAGAASVELTNLGNANFEHMKFEGGAGKFNIDLRGTYTGESRADIEIGLGAGDIILPEDVAVQIETDDDSWFSSVDLHSHKLERIDKGLYQSAGFDDAKDRIVVKLEVGLGSVDVRWRK